RSPSREIHSRTKGGQWSNWVPSLLERGFVDGIRIAVAEDDGPLDDILQLANIARPAVGLEQIERRFSMCLIFFPALFAERSTRYSPAGECHRLVRAMTERRWGTHSACRRDPRGTCHSPLQPSGRDWWPLFQTHAPRARNSAIYVSGGSSPTSSKEQRPTVRCLKPSTPPLERPGERAVAQPDQHRLERPQLCSSQVQSAASVLAAESGLQEIL